MQLAFEETGSQTTNEGMEPWCRMLLLIAIWELFRQAVHELQEMHTFLKNSGFGHVFSGLGNFAARACLDEPRRGEDSVQLPIPL